MESQAEALSRGRAQPPGKLGPLWQKWRGCGTRRVKTAEWRNSAFFCAQTVLANSNSPTRILFGGAPDSNLENLDRLDHLIGSPISSARKRQLVGASHCRVSLTHLRRLASSSDRAHVHPGTSLGSHRVGLQKARSAQRASSIQQSATAKLKLLFCKI